MIGHLVTNIIIAGAWMLLQDELTWNHFILGYLIGIVILYIGSRRSDTDFYLRRVVRGLALTLIFLYEVVKSALRVAYLLLHPGMPVEPGLLAVPLEDLSDTQVTIFAGMITMTPGTVSVELSPDRKHLYVHALEMGDPQESAQSMKDTFERRIMEVFH